MNAKLYADVGTWACGSPTQRWNLATFRSLLALLFAALLCSAVDGATITVTSVGDTTAVDGSVTLREAITSINNGANVNADVVAVGAYGTNDAIHFNIPGAGVQSILVLGALPAVTKPVIIDGYTQPLASANTNGPGQGTNAVLLVELRFNLGNLTVAGGNSTVQGLVINGASGALFLTGLGGNTVAGNFIGTDATGNAAGPHGVFALIDIFVNSTSPNNTIGGVTPAARNLISGTGTGGSSNPGILISSSGNTVQGNLIGTNAAGTAALPNDMGINIFLGGNNVIGGTTPAARNIISGNRLSGIEMDTSANTVQGNFIGTDVTGTAAIANGTFGIAVGGTGNTIGGTIAGAGNVVSGNGSMGIAFAVGATGNTVQGNRVGTDPTGIVAVGGQSVSGIEVDASNNTIGGTLAGAGNIVAFNAGAGVRVSAGTGSGINGNSIFSNGGLGIALGQAGVPNVNDPGDPDLGANNFQNYPVLTSASAGVGTVTVSGTLNSNATTAFRLEFFANAACDAPFSHGEGQSFIGFANVATDGSGNASFGPLVFGAPAGQTVVTATATDPANNTSEFSQCLGGGGLPTLSINNVSGAEGNSGTTPFNFTVTLSAPSASTVTVNYATANGTATAGSDYVATSGMLTFAPGITTQPITVLVNGDLVVEPDETVTVTLTTPTNATIATAQGTGTILNDDVAGSPGTLQFSAPTYSVGEGGGSAVITVTRVGGSSGAVSVTAATVGGGTATVGTDYTVTSVSLNWPDGDASSKTLVVPIIDDALIEPSETVKLALSAPTGGAALGAQTTAILTIIDNDAPPPPASQVIPTLSWTGLLLLTGLLALGAFVRIRLSNAPRSQTPRRR
jgi:hypothetical protein